jgi:hypothetical protein
MGGEKGGGGGGQHTLKGGCRSGRGGGEGPGSARLVQKVRGLPDR